MTRLLAFLGLLLAGVIGVRLAGLAPETLPAPAPTAPEALEQVAAGALELDLRPLWDNLPPSWQARMQAVVDALRENHDPETWELGFGVLTRAAALASLPAEEARGIDRSARLASYLGVDPEEGLDPARVTEERWRLAAALNSIVSSPLADPDNLSRVHLRQLAGVFPPDVEAEFQKLAGPEATLLGPTIRGAFQDLIASAREAQRKEPERTDFSVTWTSTTYATEVTSVVRLVEVEDRWVPDVVVAELPPKLAMLEEQVADLTSDEPGTEGTGELLLEQLRIATRGLDAMAAAANDPDAFDAALDQTVTELTAATMGHRMRTLFR